MGEERTHEIADCSYIYYLPVAVHKLHHDGLFAVGEKVVLSHAAIIAVTDGQARLEVNGTEKHLGRYTILCCDRRTSLRLLEDRSLTGVVIEFRAIALDNPCAVPFLLPRSPLTGTQPIIALAQQLEISWRERQGRPLHAQRLLLQLLEWLLEQAQNPPKPGVHWMERILELLHGRYCEEWTRESLAQLAGVSGEHFSRVFRKETGLTYIAYLNLLRIREAQRCLLNGQMQHLNQLAQQVGYKDGYYLSKKFKQATGLSPSLYISKPRRIVTSTYNHTAMLMGLGVKPVLGAYALWAKFRSPGSDDEDRELLWSEGRGSYKQLEQLEPDIIVGYHMLALDRRLSRYAAVEALSLFQLSWREHFRRVADIANKREQAEEWLTEYDGEVARSNLLLDKGHGKRGTAAVWEIYEDVAYVFDKSFGRGAQVLYEDLGFRLPEALSQRGIREKGFLAFSVQEVASIDCDYLFITEFKECLASRQLLQSPGWRLMKAVRSGQVYVFNDFASFYGLDQSSTKEQLHCLIRCLTS